MKRTFLAALAVFVAWTVLDFLIHVVMLGSTYAATAELWRPESEMKIGLMRVVVLVSAFVFAGIYAWFFGRKSVGTGVTYGALFGVGAGISMGYGTYAVMPLPYSLALAWFLGTVAEAAVGGLLVGLIVKDAAASAAS